MNLLQSIVSFISFFTMAYIYYNFMSSVLNYKFLKHPCKNFNLPLLFVNILFSISFSMIITFHNIFFENIEIKFFIINGLFLISLFAFNGNFLKKISFYLVYSLIIFNVENTIFPVVLLFTEYTNSTVHNAIQLSIFYTSLTYIIDYFILKYLSAKLLNLSEIFDCNEVKIVFYILSFLILITTSNTITLIKSFNSSNYLLNSVISFSILACTLLMLNVIGLLLNYIFSLRNYNYNSQTLSTYDDFIRLNNEYIANINKIKHDISNHLDISTNLIEQNEFDVLKTYLFDLRSTILITNPTYDTGNTLLNVIFNQKTSLANSKQVNFNVEYERLDSINLNENHLASLLFNLLDNAINASSLSKLKTVKLNITTKGDNLVIILRNSVDDADSAIKNLSSTTSAKQSFKTEHGFGLYIIIDILDKYNGFQEFNKFDEEIEICIVIPNRPL